MARRRYLIAGLAAIAVFGSVAASAATLGGVTSDSLGADVTTVASCNTTHSINLSYATSFAAGTSTTPGFYKVDSVTVNGINPACIGKNLQLSLTDTNGAAVFSSASVALPTTGTTNFAVNVPVSGAVPVSAVTGAAVIIGS